LAIQYGCSHEQIATTTGLPLGTVKTHARRGLIKLRALLAEGGVEVPEPVERVSRAARPEPAGSE
jgi:RNA polymerase sigma-70 factor (ECF subfamily)